MRAVSCRRTPTESRKNADTAPGTNLDAVRQRIEGATCDIVARDIDRDRHVAYVLGVVTTKTAQRDRPPGMAA
jgi:hypothetical protein